MFMGIWSKLFYVCVVHSMCLAWGLAHITLKSNGNSGQKLTQERGYLEIVIWICKTQEGLCFHSAELDYDAYANIFLFAPNRFPHRFCLLNIT